MFHPSLDISALHAILGKAPAAITFMDPELVVRYVNMTAAPSLSVEDVIGRHFATFFTPEQAEHVRQIYELARATRQAQRFENYVDFPDGVRRWFLSTTAALWNDDGTFAGWVNISTEVTAQRNADMALQKAQAELADASRRAGMAEVATGILHSLGNVLNSINVSTSTLIEQSESSHVATLIRVVALCEEKGKDLPDYLARDPRGRKLPALLSRLSQEIAAERRALRAELERLIELLDFGRSTLDAQQSIASTGARIEELELAELCQRALSMFRTDVADQDIIVSITTEGAQRALLDTRATLQILVNLLRNAIDALRGTHGPRRLTLAASVSAAHVVFDVIDTGCGIAAHDLPRLFQYGFTTKPDGHGVGLHAAMVTARTLGGTITATSDGPGRGARFSLSLPIHLAGE